MGSVVPRSDLAIVSLPICRLPRLGSTPAMEYKESRRSLIASFGFCVLHQFPWGGAIRYWDVLQQSAKPLDHTILDAHAHGGRCGW